MEAAVVERVGKRRQPVPNRPHKQPSAPPTQLRLRSVLAGSAPVVHRGSFRYSSVCRQSWGQGVGQAVVQEHVDRVEQRHEAPQRPRLLHVVWDGAGRLGRLPPSRQHTPRRQLGALPLQPLLASADGLELLAVRLADIEGAEERVVALRDRV